MSKNLRAILFILLASVQILHLFNKVFDQDIEVTMSAADDSPARFHIEGKFLNGLRSNNRNLVLLNQYGGIVGLSDRASVLVLKNKDGGSVSFKKLISGEYLAEENFVRWSCNYELSPIAPASANAHVSWVGPDNGILMLNDLLPQMPGNKRFSARVTIVLPDGWRITTTERAAEKNIFEVADVENAEFVISKNAAGRILSDPDRSLTVLIFDNWNFADADSLSTVRDIHGYYSRIFGSRPTNRAQVTLMKFQGSVGAGEWEADTRGVSVTILSSDAPFRSQALQQLHEQLRHELFHLWIPNGINLGGNYDWFYEGFALYQSLKTGVALNRIRFDDFLDTLSRAYNIDAAQAHTVSLIEASRNRWSGANTQVYARGMLVAFLCDLALLEASGGKISVTNIIRKVYQDHRAPAGPVDGNTAVLELLGSYAELKNVVNRNIVGAEKIDWSEALQKAGIEAIEENASVTLRVASKSSGRQKDLLDKLGYNNWRKLSQGFK